MLVSTPSAAISLDVLTANSRFPAAQDIPGIGCTPAGGKAAATDRTVAADTARACQRHGCIRSISRTVSEARPTIHCQMGVLAIEQDHQHAL